MDPSLDMLDNGNGGEFPPPEVPHFGDGVDSVAPEPDSPRTIWARENYVKLEEKERAEKYAKEELMQKASQFLDEFHAQRQMRIEATKRANREEEQKVLEMKAAPQGTIWQQIIETIDFDLGVQQKDVSRARSMLFQAKEADLPTQ